MSDGPTGDPIFEPAPVIEGAPPTHHHEHEEHKRVDDWVEVERVSGEGAKSKLNSAYRVLEQADVDARLEHDHEGRPVLEVHKADEHEALKLLNKSHGLGAPRETREEAIEAEEHEALKGPFKLATVGWVLILVAGLVCILLAGWWLIYLPR